MRRFLTILVLLTIALPGRGGDNAAVNTLTAQEIADGWLLLFDGKTAFGWSSEGGVDVEKGRLTVGGTKASNLRLNPRFGNFELQIQYSCEGKKDAALSLREEYGGMTVGGIRSQGLPRSQPMVTQRWNTLKLTVSLDNANNVEGERWLDLGTAGVEHYKLVGKARGMTLSLSFETPADTKLHLRNVKLKPLGTKSLFNGKDLSGWRVFPGKKYPSKFTVTEQGEIHVKDGPGDLQTVGKYRDFILQLDCLSNGKHLNSGIFFRCREGEYQQGYEAQIRNQFTEETKQTYVIEEYDPMTRKLIAKKKINSTNVDYGTGAIYRRIPARQSLAKDGEWFALTVLARDDHFATWVNGVQVVDWTDYRPLSDNARNGCYLEAGHISIQGHDPTTDLSFKNLRLAELPRGIK